MGGRCIIDILLDTQVDEGYEATQVDSTQEDSAKPIEVVEVSTDEDVDTTASEGELADEGLPELSLRLLRFCGVREGTALHPPPPRSFHRQAEALRCLESLAARGLYSPHELGLFSREFTSTGCRSFLVDTFPGFALTSAPRQLTGAPLPARHLYEVLVEKKPCWLYFDLEYSRTENPQLEPNRVAGAFYELLGRFCENSLGQRLDHSAVYDLDSTNADKFSKHVVLKRLEKGETLAFQNNAQAGFFIRRFMDFVREQRQAGDTSASLLFARTKPKASAKGAEKPEPEPEASIVDESVYTRNRCFRVLFSTKFGKNRPLLPTWSAAPPAQQLLESLASCVPEGTPLFRHPMIPPDWQHEDMKVGRSGKRPDRREPSEVVEVPCNASEHSALFRHLIELWDDIRSKNEPTSTHVPTRVQRSLLMSSDYMVVSLANNRFCFKKGVSHKSNGVYLVINQKRWVAYQKCHDVADCPEFRSHEFALPEELRPPAEPDAVAEDADAEGKDDPISQELLTQLMPIEDDPVTPPRLPIQRRASRSRSASPLAPSRKQRKLRRKR
ncbi:unnamed protein product, partial [Effrenium voratum]